MGKAKVAIILDEQLLRTVDWWVKQGWYHNRSQAIQAAVQEKIDRWKRTRLNEELSRLDPQGERDLVEERLSGESWPDY